MIYDGNSVIQKMMLQTLDRKRQQGTLYPDYCGRRLRYLVSGFYYFEHAASLRITCD